MNPFSFFVDDIEAARDKARAKVEAAGGVFNNNSFIGRTSAGDIVGQYMHDPWTGKVTVTISKKPFMLPMGLIEQQIKAFFEG